jgi:cytochrome c6
MKRGNDVARFAFAAICAALWVPHDARAADVFRGGELYRRHCAQCHGEDGRPVMPTAPDFTRRERLLQPDPVLLQTVRAGKGAMPGYQGLLRDRDLLDVIAFLRTLQ